MLWILWNKNLYFLAPDNSWLLGAISVVLSDSLTGIAVRKLPDIVVLISSHCFAAASLAFCSVTDSIRSVLPRGSPNLISIHSFQNESLRHISTHKKNVREKGGDEPDDAWFSSAPKPEGRMPFQSISYHVFCKNLWTCCVLPKTFSWLCSLYMIANGKI